MLEDKTFNDFYIKINAISNSMISHIKNVIRSLSERFRIKVTTIEESKDLDTKKIEELVGSLHTNEFYLPQPKKNKSIALNTVRKETIDSFDDKSMNEEVRSVEYYTFNPFNSYMLNS